MSNRKTWLYPVDMMIAKFTVQEHASWMKTCNNCYTHNNSNNYFSPDHTHIEIGISLLTSYLHARSLAGLTATACSLIVTSWRLEEKISRFLCTTWKMFIPQNFFGHHSRLISIPAARVIKVFLCSWILLKNVSESLRAVYYCQYCISRARKSATTINPAKRCKRNR